MEQDKNSLSASERLKSRKAIGKLFSDGYSISSGTLKALFIFTFSNQTTVKCGFTVSSRAFKRAVDRNRIKRLLRESYRLNKAAFIKDKRIENLEIHIFIIFRSTNKTTYAEVNNDIKGIINKLLVHINEKTP